MTGGGRSADLPKKQDPTLTPETVGGGLGVGDRTRQNRRKGRRSLILTEGGLGNATVQRESLLGNTGV